MSQELLIEAVVKIAIVLGAILTVCAYLIYVERKISAFMQDRIGPNRVGPIGLLQPLADGIKFILKEDVIPRYADKFLFILAPCIAVMTAMLAFAVVPFGPTEGTPRDAALVIAPGLDIALVYVFAVGSLAVYGIVLGGWASNNKYSLLGSLRSSAQVISYEIPLGTSVLGVVLLSSTMNIEQIVDTQTDGGVTGLASIFEWNIWVQPLAGLIFMVSALAEANRLPFDLPEAEQELIGGYHTEYSAMKFALFFLGEYTHMITVSFLISALFLGGWHFPWIAEAGSNYSGAWIVKVGVLCGKVFFLILLMMMLRWTLPRFRFDQLMKLAWQGLVPLAFLNVILVMAVLQFDLPRWILTVGSILLFVAAVMINTAVLKRRLRAPQHITV